MPFQWALLELAHGQVLRRAGQRRAAAERLSAARERFAGLRARPYLERCEQELAACGLAPAKRSAFDPSRLTAQELAVARLVAVGMSNRQVASELFISIKTVQFHLTHIYAKLGVSSRAELAAQFRDNETAETSTPGRPLIIFLGLAVDHLRIPFSRNLPTRAPGRASSGHLPADDDRKDHAGYTSHVKRNCEGIGGRCDPRPPFVIAPRDSGNAAGRGLRRTRA